MSVKISFQCNLDRFCNWGLNSTDGWHYTFKFVVALGRIRRLRILKCMEFIFPTCVPSPCAKYASLEMEFQKSDYITIHSKYHYLLGIPSKHIIDILHIISVSLSLAIFIKRSNQSYIIAQIFTQSKWPVSVYSAQYMSKIPIRDVHLTEISVIHIASYILKASSNSFKSFMWSCK